MLLRAKTEPTYTYTYIYYDRVMITFVAIFFHVNILKFKDVFVLRIG